MRVQDSHQNLTERTFFKGINELSARDKDLAEIISKCGNPPFWTHPAGFSGIVLAILSQQVSVESAQATFSKLKNSVQSINPEELLSLDDIELRRIGFSRQKASHVRGIAQDLVSGELDLDALEAMEDDQARKRLMGLRGVGPWTADTYLLFALRRSDVWPSGDLALEKAVREIKGLARTPRTEEVDRIASEWKPWRAVAAKILWHYYLSERGRTSSA